jgi:hypothetical protein
LKSRQWERHLEPQQIPEKESSLPTPSSRRPASARAAGTRRKIFELDVVGLALEICIGAASAIQPVFFFLLRFCECELRKIVPFERKREVGEQANQWKANDQNEPENSLPLGEWL